VATLEQDRFSLVFRLCPIGLALTAEGGRIIEANPALGRLLGYDAESLEGRRLLDLTHPDDRATSAAAGASVIDRERDETTLNKRYVRSDGTVVDVCVTMIVLDDPGGEARKLTQVEDLTSQRARETRLEQQLERDPLTGLTNRRGLDRRLEPLLEPEGKEPGPTWAVLYVDLDDFKDVNDRFGHRTGDKVLEVVGQILDKGTREDDLVARVGGDEFVVVMRIANPAEADSAVERLSEALDRPIRVGAETVHVRASIGAAIPRRDDSPDEVLERADREMYRSKRTR
jgi:diguanylate cyclase (GGDEF)-like protein/PAS domain S-box-containing protein